MKKTILIDRKFASDLKFENFVSLLPAADFPVSWSLKDHERIVKAIVLTNERIAKLYAEKIYAKHLPYDAKNLEILYYGFGTGISFLICDRLLRLNRLFKDIPASDLNVLSVNYSFPHRRTQTDEDFYEKSIEDDPIFNQWILERLSGSLERVSLKNSDIPSFQETHHFPKKASFTKRLWNRIRSQNLTFHKMISSICIYFGQFFLEHMSLFKPQCIAIGEIGPFREVFAMSGGFFWPLGPLLYLPLKVPACSCSHHHSKITREPFKELRKDISEIFFEFISLCGDRLYLPSESLDGIADLISELLPNLAVEDLEYASHWALANLKKTRSDLYFAYSPVGGPVGVLYNFAARELGKKIVSTQHSAWGGYLSGGALVSELLIRGSDDYITFGWTNKEEGMASWRNKAVPLCSPLLSSMSLKVLKNNRMDLQEKPKRKVILCTGFLYRFPMIYNSGLKIDVIDLWIQNIQTLISTLAKHKIHVSVKMYNKSIANLYAPMLKKWVNAGGEFSEEYPDHNVRMRALFHSGRFYDDFDAVIWDIPTGGFTEALVTGVRTFAYLDRDIVSVLPEAMETLNPLLQSGVLFSDAERLSSALDAMYENSEWYSSQQKHLQNFQNRYCRISKDWKEDWQNYFNEPL